MVNDGSTDRSVEVVRDFMAIRPAFGDKVRLISYNFRRGSEAARKIGLEEARGKYLAHCDADDRTEPQWLQEMYDEAERTGADLVIAPYLSENPKGKIKKITPDHIPEGLNRMTINTVNFSLCNKLIRREFITSRGVTYLPGVERWEDLGLLTQIYASGAKTAEIGSASYHYLENPHGNTLSRSKKEILLRDHLMMALLIEQWLDEKGLTESYTPYLNYLKYISKIKYLRSRDKDIKTWLATFPEVNTKIMGMRRVPLPVRLLTSAVALLPAAISQRVADFCDIFYK